MRRRFLNVLQYKHIQNNVPLGRGQFLPLETLFEEILISCS